VKSRSTLSERLSSRNATNERSAEIFKRGPEKPVQVHMTADLPLGEDCKNELEKVQLTQPNKYAFDEEHKPRLSDIDKERSTIQ
jgi:hypothetical protein